LAYLAAYDVGRAQVFGRCEPTTGVNLFDRLVQKVMGVEPYASAERVFWIVDNGSSRRGRASIRRLEGQWKNMRLIHLPVHASWLDNGVEIYFSVVQRKVVSSNDFFDLAEIEGRLAAFEQRYNAVAEPFGWTFTRDDLNKLLLRIAAYERDAPLPLAASAPLSASDRRTVVSPKTQSPPARIGQVQPARAVQGLLVRSGEHSAGKDRILVAVTAGQVDGESQVLAEPP
jgi:hypothetical protein